MLEPSWQGKTEVFGEKFAPVHMVYNMRNVALEASQATTRFSMDEH